MIANIAGDHSRMMSSYILLMASCIATIVFFSWLVLFKKMRRMSWSPILQYNFEILIAGLCSLQLGICLISWILFLTSSHG